MILKELRNCRVTVCFLVLIHSIGLHCFGLVDRFRQDVLPSLHLVDLVRSPSLEDKFNFHIEDCKILDILQPFTSLAGYARTSIFFGLLLSFGTDSIP